jgi:hypothetical protein
VPSGQVPSNDFIVHSSSSEIISDGYRVLLRLRPNSPYLRIGLLILATTISVGLVAVFGGLEYGELTLLVVLFASGSLAFVGSQGRFSGQRLLELPCFLTIAFLVEFGLVPFLRHLGVDPFFASYPTVDNRALVRGLVYVMVGMVGFWAGCACFLSKNGRRQRPLLAEEAKSESPSRARVLTVAFVLFAIGFAARLYMLEHHIYYYIGSLDIYYSNLASAQIVGFLAPFGGLALIIVAIERFSGAFDAKVNLYFWSVFLSECVWGLISGMKSQLLQNFLLVGVVVSFLRPQIAKRWVLGFVVGLVLIYPLFDQYRFLVRGPFSIVIGSPGQALRTQRLALLQAAERADGSSGWVEAGFQSTLDRLDMLESVSTIVSLKSETSQLRGDERLWMIPFYPFVPRFMWKSKPILDKGARFSEVLGYGNQTSTSVTYPADLYLSLGVSGIIVGMFLLGILARRVTNVVACTFSRRDLFLYTSLFLACTNIENDAFSFWTGFIKTLVTISAIAWVVYVPAGQLIGLSLVRQSSPSGRGLHGTFEPQRALRHIRLSHSETP